MEAQFFSVFAEDNKDMTITRVGSNATYADGWESIFGGAPSVKSPKGKGAKKASPAKTASKSAVKPIAKGKTSVKKAPKKSGAKTSELSNTVAKKTAKPVAVKAAPKPTTGKKAPAATAVKTASKTAKKSPAKKAKK